MQSPDTQLAYIVCTVEHFVGIMMSSLLLGIVFAKASMPTNKTAFSRVCLITARCAPAATLRSVSFQSNSYNLKQ